ncbi:MAG TPA: hypothetical protein VET90_09575, partial [Candidatus Binatus sp.]|nr:hypothetical protein [Candidatus Binatus sp.]
TGVTVLAVVAAIGGVLSLLGALALLGIGAVFAAYYGLGALASIFGLLILALGVAELAIAYGFWTLKPWAWTWGITIEAVGVLLSLVELVLGYGSISSLIIGVVVAGIVIYYLNMPDIRKAFAAPDKGWPFIGNVGT